MHNKIQIKGIKTVSVTAVIAISKGLVVAIRNKKKKYLKIKNFNNLSVNTLYSLLTLVMMGGRALCAPPKCYYFFTKNLSP